MWGGAPDLDRVDVRVVNGPAGSGPSGLEHTGGGHAFDFLLDEGVVEIATVSELRLSLPTSGPFLAADLNNKDIDAGIRKSEG